MGPAPSLFANLDENLRDPLGRLFSQLILILAVARLCGALAARVGQPAVIGEMVAGILLGPSLLGWVWPEGFQFIFPGPSLGTLRLLSQIGICLFMFVVGMELEVDQLRHAAHAAVVVSQVSILFPYFLGVVAWLRLFPTLAAPNTTFLAFALFVVVMRFWVRPCLPRWVGTASLEGGDSGQRDDGRSAGLPAGLGARADLMGIHALFGAFLAGVVMPPHGEFRDYLKIRLEHFSSAFLLPLFLAFTGLRTRIDLLSGTGGWRVCLGLIFVATLGKLGGTLVAARVTGVNWIDAFALGALMNTRGLIELIALNIGYDLGILSPRIFAMLVIMALATTCLAGPCLTLADAVRVKKSAIAPSSG